MNRNGSILVIDDEEIMRDLDALLTRQGYGVRLAENAAQGWSRQDPSFDAVVVDMMMPGMDGIRLDELKKIDDDLPVLMITVFASVENAIVAMKRGAFDYITAVQERRSACVLRSRGPAPSGDREPHFRQNLQAHANRFGEIIGRSSRMREVFDLIMAAPSRTTMLINGEMAPQGAGGAGAAPELHPFDQRSSP
jgi:DNA-binding NtrC family response regulator